MRLRGRRVLVTRARGQASALVDRLREEGAEVVEIPTIELAPPASWCGLDAALTTLASYDWLLLTSANAVAAMGARAARLGVMLRPRRIAVVGPATARAAVESGLAAAIDLMPERYVAEALAELLEPLAAGTSMLLVRAEKASELLPERLRAAGAELTIATAYRNVVPSDSVTELRALLGGEGVDAVTLTSASTAENLAQLLATAGCGLPEAVKLVSIGPVTSAAMRELGLVVAAEAREATIAGLVDSLIKALHSSRGVGDSSTTGPGRGR